MEFLKNFLCRSFKILPKRKEEKYYMQFTCSEPGNLVYYHQHPDDREKAGETAMDQGREEKLVMELRDQVSDLLSAVQLLTPLVRERGNKQDGKNLSYLNQSLYRLLRTVNHMDITQNSDPIFSPRPVDLGGLCRDVGRQVEGIAPDLGISFWWEIDRDGVFSMADGALLEQAILNLLTNAFQHAGAGGHVELRCSLNGERFTVTVRDDGPGLIPPDPDADPLVKRPGGLGLGLEAARRVASLHGGVLMLENENPGVRAILSLPVRTPTEEEKLRDKGSRFDRTGGFSQLLVEFSPLLPPERFTFDDVE